MVTGEEDFMCADLLARPQLELDRGGRAERFAVPLTFAGCV